MIRILSYSESMREEIFARATMESNVSEVVSDILADVRQNGDKAVLAYSDCFDGANGAPLKVTKAEIAKAVAGVDKAFMGVLQRAAENIRAFHAHQVRSGFVVSEQEGVLLGQKVLPLGAVGLYVPGGTASYPSSVLMNAIPAKLAGVERVVMVTPAKGGVIPREILAAAQLGGVDEIYRVGGAQAIGALAYGTETIRRVDKIVGPGNAFVAEAKRQVSGLVDIDMIAGPSEILIVADEGCDPVWVAADMLSQAEHDKNASAVLITVSQKLAKRVQAELERQIPLLPRADIARASIDNNGKIVVSTNIAQAIDIANDLAPEHLELCLDAPFDYLDRVRCAGSVFLGKYAPEALGDYFAGPNHVLPTSGTARFSSPLSVDDFVKKYSFTYYTASALAKVQQDIQAFAMREGLDAHARSVAVRFEEE
ncbi:MAG: histidinol dehydrogenase [Clostridia bacterium]|nr:histidinol dehydrogenase [Clostridia bacterium]